MPSSKVSANHTLQAQAAPRRALPEIPEWMHWLTHAAPKVHSRPRKNGLIPGLFRADQQTERLSAYAILAEREGFEHPVTEAPPGLIAPFGVPSRCGSGPATCRARPQRALRWCRGDRSDRNHSGPSEDRIVPGRTSGTARQDIDPGGSFCRCHLCRAAGKCAGATCAYTR